MKKLASIFSTIVVLCAILTVCASVRASDQIDGGWAAAQAASNGQVTVEFQVNGTGKMSKIGANLKCSISKVSRLQKQLREYAKSSL